MCTSQRTRDRHHRADRQVDAARRDDQRHSQCDKHGGCAVAQDVDEAAVEVAVFDPDGKERRCENDVEAQQCDQCQYRPQQLRSGQAAHHRGLPLAIKRVSSETGQPPSIWAMLCPSRSTAMRSLMRATSSSSAEMNSTAIPSAARSLTSFWIWALAPTSMPRVGSSRMSSAGWVISQRASSTFCWLPPLRFLMGMSGSRGRMSSISIYRRTSMFLAFAVSGLAKPRRACNANTRLSRTLSSLTMPSPLRSSEVKPNLCAMAARGERNRAALPSTLI